MQQRKTEHHAPELTRLTHDTMDTSGERLRDWVKNQIRLGVQSVVKVRRMFRGAAASTVQGNPVYRSAYYGEGTYCEHVMLQHHGFASMPPEEAHVVVVAIENSEDHLISVASGVPNLRPALEDGEVALYHQSGAMVKLKANGDIEVTPAAGRDVVLAGGSAGVARVGDRVTLDPDTITAIDTACAAGGGFSLAGFHTATITEGAAQVKA